MKEHGFQGNYITEGASDSIDPRFPGEVGYISPGDMASKLRRSAELIEHGAEMIDDMSINPEWIEGFESWSETMDSVEQP